MSDITSKKCPICKQTIHPQKNRLIVELCGHSKCRLCFIKEENGCILCNKNEPNKECINKSPVKKACDDSNANHSSKISFDEEEARDNLSISDIDSDSNGLKINTDTSESLDSLKSNESSANDKRNCADDVIKSDSISCNKQVQIIENLLISFKEIDDKHVSTDLKSDNNADANDTSLLPSHIVVNATDDVNKLTYTCKICQKTFKSKNNGKYHLYCDSSVPKPFSCTHCDKRFITASHLDYHRQTHSDSRTFACKFCDKHYMREISLKKHERKHKNDFRYVCKHCNKKFLYREQLRVHENQHDNISFTCSKCQKTFFNKSNLSQHLLTHSGIKTVTCKVCNKKFSRNSALKTHQLIHLKNRPYKCKTCGKGFIDQRTVERHSKTHFENTFYECTLCPTKSNRRDNIRRHVRNLHSDASEGIKVVLATIIENYTKKSVIAVNSPKETFWEKSLDDSLEHQSNTTSVIKFIGKLDIDEAKNNADKELKSSSDCSVIVNTNAALNLIHPSASSSTSSNVESALSATESVSSNIEPCESKNNSPVDNIYNAIPLKSPSILPPVIEPLQLLPPPPQHNISVYRQLLSPYLKPTAKQKSNSVPLTTENLNNFLNQIPGTSTSTKHAENLIFKGNAIVIDKPPKKMYDKNEIYRSIMNKK